MVHRLQPRGEKICGGACLAWALSPGVRRFLWKLGGFDHGGLFCGPGGHDTFVKDNRDPSTFWRLLPGGTRIPGPARKHRLSPARSMGPAAVHPGTAGRHEQFAHAISCCPAQHRTPCIVHIRTGLPSLGMCATSHENKGDRLSRMGHPVNIIPGFSSLWSTGSPANHPYWRGNRGGNHAANYPSLSSVPGLLGDGVRNDVTGAPGRIDALARPAASVHPDAWETHSPAKKGRILPTLPPHSGVLFSLLSPLLLLLRQHSSLPSPS